MPMEYLQGLAAAKHEALSREVLAVQARIETALDEFQVVLNPKAVTGGGMVAGEVHVPGQGRRGAARTAWRSTGMPRLPRRGTCSRIPPRASS